MNRRSDKFLNSLADLENFKNSDLEPKDVYFDNYVARTVLYGFLNRSYCVLNPNDFLDHPELEDTNVKLEDIQNAFNILRSNGFIRKTANGHELNFDNKSTRKLQNSMVEYLVKST